MGDVSWHTEGAHHVHADDVSVAPPAPGALVREYRDADAGGVRVCVVELQDFERRIDDRLRPGDSIADEYLQHMLDRCRELAGAILVAEIDGVVAGFVRILARVRYDGLDEPPGEYALVADLAVRERFRRRGLGAALLRAAEDYARSRGATELRVGVLSGNRGAANLYRKVGFSAYLETLSKRLT
jgi:ribosomal protein S18 acetylase RimI-like enzyme